MPETVAVSLAETGARFGRWSEVEIQRTLDGYTAVSLSGPFDHHRAEVRRAFQPLTFPAVTVSVGDDLILTGYVKDVAPNEDAGLSSVGVTAYSVAAELAEITPAPDLLPLEFNGLDLRQIAQRLITPSIGLDPIFYSPPGAVFGRVRSEPDNPIHSFLVDLAIQRGFVLTDHPLGNAMFRAETQPGAPVARLEGQPLVKVTARFDPGSWFSTVTGRAARKGGKPGARYTEPNPLYRANHPRHYTMRLGDTEGADVPKTAAATIGRMVASVVSYTVEDIPTWRDPSGRLWEPNTTLTVLAPGAMIYRETELLIRAVTLKQTPEGETATLSLVMPGCFGGKLPEALPWDF
jgi:prophage tail gpP-like protein